ncbi:alpha/beta hydrolase family protein [Streptomyces sp. NPDC048208]|uniref:alpha/beta hydrolase family protein n=1 Tax=Streptomyces sp. NPDC048208 TaxID=3365515 RepID=UPI0037171D82
MTDSYHGQAALEGFLDMWTTGTTAGRRAPVLRRPGEVGLEYEDVFFPSMDGVPIDGWFIPAGSDKLVIQNHFLPGNRYGYPGQLPEFGGLGGFEVNFLPEFKALHDAGYNILCYDIRNFGLSGAGNGDTVGIGLLEYRDVIGSVRYARSRPDTKDMTTVLLSVCLGADSTCVAMARHPDEFAGIPSLILLQPVSGSYIIEEFVKANEIPDGYARFDKGLVERTGFHLAEQSPLEYAKSIHIPTLVAQVHHDSMTRPEDVQSIYDAIPAEDKKRVWIEGTTRRFDGYNYFGEHPEVAIEWFDSHLG